MSIGQGRSIRPPGAEYERCEGVPSAAVQLLLSARTVQNALILSPSSIESTGSGSSPGNPRTESIVGASEERIICSREEMTSDIAALA